MPPICMAQTAHVELPFLDWPPSLDRWPLAFRSMLRRPSDTILARRLLSPGRPPARPPMSLPARSRLEIRRGRLVRRSIQPACPTDIPERAARRIWANAVFTGALTLSTSSYYSVMLTPTAGLAVQLTGFNFGTRSTSTGPTTFALYSSVDNFTNPIFVDTGIPVSGNTYVFETNSGFTLTGAVGSAVTLELFTYGGTGSATSGTENNRIDDVAITADGISSAVPEPTTCLAGALMVGAMGWSQRRRLAGLMRTDHAA